MLRICGLGDYEVCVSFSVCIDHSYFVKPHRQGSQIFRLQFDNRRSRCDGIAAAVDEHIVHLDSDKLADKSVCLESKLGGSIRFPTAVIAFHYRIIGGLVIAAGIADVIIAEVMCCFAAGNDRAAAGDGTLLPVVRFIPFPFEGGVCNRQDHGFFIRTGRTGSLFCTGGGTGGRNNHPFAVSMRLLFCCIAAAANLAYLPMAVGVAVPAVNMGMLLIFVFCTPVGSPSAVHHADAVITACRNAICFTAVLTQTALLADRSAVRAVLIALHANVCAIFTGVTALAKDRTVGAIFPTILTQCGAIAAAITIQAQVGTVLTDAAIRAEDAAIAAMIAAAVTDSYTVGAVFLATATQRYTIFAQTTIQTHISAAFTGAAIRAKHPAFAAGAAAIRANYGTVHTAKSATAANIYAVFTKTALLADGRASLTGAAIVTHGAALTAISFTIRANNGAIRASSAAVAYEAALAAQALTIGTYYSAVFTGEAFAAQCAAVDTHIAAIRAYVHTVGAVTAVTAVIIRLLTAHTAARTMFHILYAAGHAHTAVIAPALYAFAAKSAALAVAVIYKAVAAIDAVAIVVLGAL